MPQATEQFDLAIELLDSLVRRSTRHLPTTLVVCCSKEDFLAEVTEQIRAAEQPQPQQQPQPQGSLSLLTPTLGLLAASESIRIVYCPSLPVLRAYLAKYSATTPPHPHRLEILDLIALHHGSSEFTLQGLSRTLASLVAGASRSQAVLRLCECGSIDDPTNPFRGSKIWDAEVPLLSSSIKIGQEGSRWARRGISVRKIVSRWFTFEPSSQQQQQQQQQQQSGGPAN